MKEYATIQIEKELYRQLRLHCIDNDKKISTFVRKLIIEAIAQNSLTTKMPTNILRVKN